MFKRVFKHLTDKGFNVFSAGSHIGICNEPYVVIKERGEQPFLAALTVKYIDINIYYPTGKYSCLEAYTKDLRAAMEDMKEMRYMHVMSPATIDNDVKAYTVSIMYRVIAKRA